MFNEITEPSSKQRHYLLLGSAIAIFLVALAVLFYSYGLKAYNSSLIQKKATLNKELEELKAHVVTLKTNSQINQRSLEQSRETILLLEQQLYQQQQDIAAYKQTINKQAQDPILIIKDILISPTDKALTYRYKLIITRTDKSEAPLEGSLQLSIVGTQLKKTTTLLWDQVSSSLDYQNNIIFSFTNILMIPEGNHFAEITLPEGFTPETIKIAATMKESKQTIMQYFTWPNEKAGDSKK